MRLANPRLIDYFGLTFSQDDVDFAIPHLKEDLPLYLDPFLLWSSENQKYRVLHDQLLDFFDQVRTLVHRDQESDVLRLLLSCEEPKELGLGYALGHKRGSAVGPQAAKKIVNLFKLIPQLHTSNVSHIEVLQLLVPGIAEDRISDLTAAILKDYFVQFTIDRANKLQIPTKSFIIPNIYEHKRKVWKPGIKVELPYNPIDQTPLLFAPLDLLRHLPWINYEDYYRSYYMPYVLPPDAARRKGQKEQKEAVLRYNRDHYVEVQHYVAQKEHSGLLCKPDPLFQPLQLPTLKRKLEILRDTPTGMENDNDKKYEKAVFELLSSLLYPELEYAAEQVRTAEGTHIRDLMFYNDGKTEFTRDLRQRYNARQIVFELKNVKQLERDHVNQLYRYMDVEIGQFGIMMTRNRPPKAIMRNTVDLHSSKRCVILCFDDSDLEMMVNLLESNRRPLEIMKKKFVEFTRLLPK